VDGRVSDPGVEVGVGRGEIGRPGDGVSNGLLPTTVASATPGDEDGVAEGVETAIFVGVRVGSAEQAVSVRPVKSSSKRIQYWRFMVPILTDLRSGGKRRLGIGGQAVVRG
jgi:hypothetical protein